MSAGSIVAAAYASGASPDEIARAGCAMRFGDVARWSLSRMGFVVNERMRKFLERLLKRYRFEEMEIPLGVLATDLVTGRPVCFHGSGDVFLPVRASCAYPGLFQPVLCEGRSLVDGAISMEIGARLARQLGATHVISVHLPAPIDGLPRSLLAARTLPAINRAILPISGPMPRQRADPAGSSRKSDRTRCLADPRNRRRSCTGPCWRAPTTARTHLSARRR